MKIYINSNEELLKPHAECCDCENSDCEHRKDFANTYGVDAYQLEADIMSEYGISVEVVYDSIFKNWVGGKHHQMRTNGDGVFWSSFDMIPNRIHKTIEYAITNGCNKANKASKSTDNPL